MSWYMYSYENIGKLEHRGKTKYLRVGQLYNAELQLKQWFLSPPETMIEHLLQMWTKYCMQIALESS